MESILFDIITNVDHLSKENALLVLKMCLIKIKELNLRIALPKADNSQLKIGDNKLKRDPFTNESDFINRKEYKGYYRRKYSGN